MSAVLLSWNIRPSVVLFCLLGLLCFTLGWGRLRRKGAVRLATIPRLLAFWLGIGTLFVALSSALDVYSEVLFLMHMGQHLLLAGVAPLLIMASNPLPFSLWGLPGKAPWQVRTKLANALFGQTSLVRDFLQRVGNPAIVGFLYILFMIGWHDPGLYQKAIYSRWLHDLEHLCFYLSGALVYWMVFSAGPRYGKKPGIWVLLLLLVITNTASMAVGVAITLADAPIYTHYAEMPRVWGLSVMEDQNIAGLLMWLPGGVPNTIAGIWLLVEYFRHARPSSKKETHVAVA